MLGTVTADHDEQRAVETLLEFRCEALILLGTDHSAADLQALAATTPVVLIGRRAAAPNLDVVRSADNQGLEQVVDHPVGLGHRRIAHIDGGAGAISVDRRRGYRTAMAGTARESKLGSSPGTARRTAGATRVPARWIPFANIDFAASARLAATTSASCSSPRRNRWRTGVAGHSAEAK